MLIRAFTVVTLSAVLVRARQEVLSAVQPMLLRIFHAQCEVEAAVASAYLDYQVRGSTCSSHDSCIHELKLHSRTTGNCPAAGRTGAGGRFCDGSLPD